MGVRRDQITLGEDELAYVQRRTCVDGIEAPQLTKEVNAQFHAGLPVRTVSAIRMMRTKHGWKLARNVEAGSAAVVQKEQEVTRRETEDGIDLLAVGRRIKTVDDLVKHAGIDLTRYEIHQPEATSWDTTVRDPETGQPVTVQNHRVHVKARLKAGPNVLEAVEALIAGAFAQRKPLPQKARKPAKGADLLQSIVIADPHIAKHAWGRETGHGDYDIAIATRLLRDSCAALWAWGDREPVGRRALWLVGDYLHYDTPNGQTTNGTALERDGRVEKMLSEGVATLVDIIEAGAARGPLDVVLVPGNHDALMTVALRHILTAHFRHDQRVTVDAGATTRKYVTHGKCLIGLTHGDKAQKRLGELMALEAREAWGRATYKEVHHGHRHSDAEVTTVGGVVIRQHPALCPPDGWHAAEGYVGAPRRMWSFLYDAAGGDGALVGTRSAGAA